MRRVRLDNGPPVSKRGPSVRATRDGGIRSRSTCSSMRSKMNPAVPAMTIRLSRPLAKGAIMARPARAAAWICAGILAVACSGTDAPTSPTVPQSSAFVASSPQLSGSAASNHGATAATGPGDVVYVSLPPGSIPNAGAITIRVEPGGALVNANAVDGGLDPVAVPAAAGDTLYIEVQVPGKSPVLNIMPVPKTGHPVVIRTSPPTQKRDVPLNANILVVFSEPITLSSWNANTVQLTQGSTAIPSSAGFQDADHLMATLTPTGPLGAGTDYTLTINQGVQDFAGQRLPAPVTVQFTTAGAAKPIDTLPHGQLAFVGADARIHLINADGSGDTAITAGPADAPAWSPDGTRLAFVGDSGIYLMNADGSGVVHLIAGGTEPAWSPDGRRIAFAMSSQIAIANIDGSGFAFLSAKPADFSDGPGDFSPAWSIDGSRIAFVRSPAPDSDPSLIYVMRVDVPFVATAWTFLPNGGGCASSSPAWSPDGQKLLFWSFCSTGLPSPSGFVLSGFALGSSDGTGGMVPLPIPSNVPSREKRTIRNQPGRPTEDSLPSVRQEPECPPTKPPSTSCV